MGLNDSSSQIHQQILLLDHLPPINKAFSLISQEERRRKVSSQNSLLGSDFVDPVNGIALHFEMSLLNTNQMSNLLEITKVQGRKDHFVLIAISMAILLIIVTNCMVVHQDTNTRNGFKRRIPILLIKFLIAIHLFTH